MITNTNIPKRVSMRGRPGFTLMEVLVAMGIFAVGFIAVAALLPVGTILQRRAFDSVNSQAVARTAKSQLLGRPFEAGDLVSKGADTDEVQAIAAVVTSDWDIMDRSFPTHQQQLGDRTFFWYPLFRWTNPGPTATASDWHVFVFILKRMDDNKVPTVKKISASAAGDTFTVSGTPNSPFLVGDQVLASDGSVYTLIDVNGNKLQVDGKIIGSPNGLWYGIGNDRRTSTQRIILVADAVH